MADKQVQPQPDEQPVEETKAVKAAPKKTEVFSFPEYGVSIEAESLEHAVALVKHQQKGSDETR